MRVTTIGEPLQPEPVLVSLEVTPTPPQLSLEETEPRSAAGMSATQFTVTLAGQLIEGASLSDTLIVKLHEAALP